MYEDCRGSKTQWRGIQIRQKHGIEKARFQSDAKETDMGILVSISFELNMTSWRHIHHGQTEENGFEDNHDLVNVEFLGTDFFLSSLTRSKFRKITPAYNPHPARHDWLEHSNLDGSRVSRMLPQIRSQPAAPRSAILIFLACSHKPDAGENTLVGPEEILTLSDRRRTGFPRSGSPKSYSYKAIVLYLCLFFCLVRITTRF